MNLEPLLYWVQEREAIRKKKEAGLREPWTNDPILQKYRFCNVRRSDDRVSKWIIKWILPPSGMNVTVLDIPEFDDWLRFTALARWVNWPPTLHKILAASPPPKALDWEAIGSIIDQRCSSGEKAWTGAYMVRAKPKGSTSGKGHFIAVDVVQGMTPHLPAIKEALKTGVRENVWHALRKAKNFGSFMAGQIVADWGYTPLLKNASDTYTWAPQGPGSVRGLNRLLGRPYKTKFKDEDFCSYLRFTRNHLIERLGKEYKDLTLHDVQSCMCEYDKYARAVSGEGRPRSTYKPETAF